MNKKLSAEKCKSCYGKRYYTQMIGHNHAPDFIGDRWYRAAPKICKIACPECNLKNRRRIKGVAKTLWEALGKLSVK